MFSETPAVEVKAENTAAPKRKVGRPRKNADAAEQKEVESVKTATPATPKVTEDKVVTEKAPEVIEKASVHAAGSDFGYCYVGSYYCYYYWRYCYYC